MVAQTNESSVSVTYRKCSPATPCNRRHGSKWFDYARNRGMHQETRNFFQQRLFFTSRGQKSRRQVRRIATLVRVPWGTCQGTDASRPRATKQRFWNPESGAEGICWQRIRRCLTDQQKSW